MEKLGSLCQPQKYKFLTDSNVTGKLYERNWFALMALRGCRPDIEDMWIGFNMGAFNKFDDVVMYCRVKRGAEVVYCMQVKLRTSMLQEQQLIGASGDFSLLACQSSIVNIKQSVRQLMGRDVPFKCGFITSMAASTEKSDVFVQTDDTFFHSSPASKTFKLSTENVIKICSQPLDPNYVSDVLICTEQAKAQFMEGVIRDEIRTLLESYGIVLRDVDLVARNYLAFIAKWVQGELGSWNTLTKTVLIFKLVELVSRGYETRFVNATPWKKFAPFYLWNYLMENRRVIIVPSDDYTLKFIGGLMLNKMSKICGDVETSGWQGKIDKDDFYRTFDEGQAKFEMLGSIGRHGEMYTEDVYRVMWKLGRIPGVFTVGSIDDYVVLVNAFKIVDFLIPVVLMCEVSLSELPVLDNVPLPVKSASDLSESARNVLFKHNVSLQGKGPVQLRNIIEADDVTVHHQITTKDVISIIQGDLNVGNALDALPDIHIRRTVPRIGLAAASLKYEEQFFVVNSTGDCLKRYVEANKIFIFNIFAKSEAKIDDYVFQTGSDNFESYCEDFPERCFHYLLLHEPGQLEWIKSRGTTTKIAQYRRDVQLPPIDVESVVGHFSNSINIISADPGAGKTILMRYLSVTHQKHDWVLQIDLNKYMRYYDTAGFCERSGSEHLRYFNGEILKAGGVLNALNNAVFENLLVLKRVLVLLDGFDEIAPLYTQEVTSLALSLRKEGYPLWLTTRPVMRNHVEAVFDTFSLTLTLFSDEEQTILLTAYYKQRVQPKNYRQQKMIDYFVSELLNKCKLYLNDFDNKFMGIPLQIFLLGQVFAKNCCAYVATGSMDVVNFDLLDLYDEFTQMKIDVMVEKFGHNIKFTQKNLHENHRLYALKVLFPKEDLRDIEEYIEAKVASFMEDIKDATDKTGIVVADVNVNFVHRSVSEYFAAKWLSENLHSATGRKLLEKIFEPNFSVIRNVFDRILAKKSALLTAVINQQYNAVEDLITKGNGNVEDVDSEGRNIVCVAASWGDRHTLPFLGKFENRVDHHQYTIKSTSSASKILDLLLEQEVACVKDTLLNLTPLDYAIKSCSLAAANSLIRKFSGASLFIELYNAYDYLYVCARYNYSHLAKKILTELNSPLLLQIDSFCDGLNPLHVASQHGHLDMVNLLLAHNADPKLKCRNGMTAFDYAQHQGSYQVVQVLSAFFEPTSARSVQRSVPISRRRKGPFNFETTWDRFSDLEDRKRAARETKLNELRKKRGEEMKNTSSFDSSSSSSLFKDTS